jgi:RNA polymerase sigma factor (sigma-70 family)
MPQPLFADVLHYLRRTCGAQAARDLADAELLKRFLADRQDPAFTVLVHRHGRMVLAVCQRLLGDAHAAEDAFQATFMVLVRRAASFRGDKPLGSWLHAVARRIALRARAQAALRRDKERRLSNMPRSESLDDVTWQELRSVLDDEIARLPEKFRAPIVMCYLEGRSYQQAAQELGCPKSSLASRLDRGRELLRQQLTRRGIAMPAAALTTALCEKAVGAPVGAILTINTAKAAVSIAAGKAVAGGCLSATAISLAEEAISAMTATKAMLVFMVVALGLTVGGVGLAGYGGWVGQSPPVKAEPVPPVLKGKQAAVEKKGSDVAVDDFGDPLPAGAMARLGTVRFRPGGSVVFAPDGKTLVSSGLLMSGICLWDVATGRRLYRVGVNPRASSLAFSPDGKTLFNGGNFSFLEAETGKQVRTVEAPPRGQEFPVAFSPDGKMVAGGGMAKDGNAFAKVVVIWEAATGKEIRRWPVEQNAFALDLAFSPNSRVLAAAIIGDTVRLWDIESGKQLRTFDHGQAARSVAFSPNGKVIATAADGAGVRFWNAETGEVIHSIKDSAVTLISGLNFSKDGKIAAARLSGNVRLWDPETGMAIRDFRPASSFAFSPNGKLFATTTGPTIRIWETDTWKEVHRSNNHTDAPISLSYSADGRTLISCGRDQRVLEWDLTTGRQRERFFGGQLGLPQEGYRIAISAVSTDGALLAQESHGADAKAPSAIRLWDTVSGKELRSFGQLSRLQSVKFSPDGKVLASASNSGTFQSPYFKKDKNGGGTPIFTELPAGTGGIQIWDTASGKQLRHFQAPNLHVTSIEFSPNGKLLASVDSDPTKDAFNGAAKIRIWDAATGKELQSWEDKGRLGLLSFSPDGKSIAYASPDLVQVRATGTGKEIHRLRRPLEDRFVAGLAYSPSGRVLAVVESHHAPSVSMTALPEKDSKASCVICLWDILTGQEIRQIQVPPESYVSSMTFAPDGQSLATGGADTAILLWDVTAGKKIGNTKETLLTAEDLNGLWSDLTGDGAKADTAIWSLARAPRQSAPFLKERLHLPSATAEELAKFIADLDSNQFAVRQKAAKSLEELQNVARPALLKALDSSIPLEVRRRIEQIVTQIDKEVIRTLRAVEALEHIGTAEARQVLEALAANAPSPRVSEAARGALERLRLRT